MLLVKKYPNRRLYDTRSSRYITLDDLEKTIQKGDDVVVQDAQDGRDLTQETLTQIILERGNGRILPASLLLRLIRLDDAALGEFLTRYVGWALDMYMHARDGARALLPLNPLATTPFTATDAIARLFMGAAPWGRSPEPPFPPPASSTRSAAAPSEPIDVLAAEPPPEPERTAGGGRIVRESPSGTTSTAELGDEMVRLRREIEALKASMTGGSSTAGAPARKPTKRKAAKRAR